MALAVIKPIETNEVTIHELIVAREYYTHVVHDVNICILINEALFGGVGYTRQIDSEELLIQINKADREKVMRL